MRRQCHLISIFKKAIYEWVVVEEKENITEVEDADRTENIERADISAVSVHKYTNTRTLVQTRTTFVPWRTL